MKNCRAACLLFAALASSSLMLSPAHAAGSLAPPQHLAYQPGSLVWNAVPGADYYLVGQADAPSGPYRTFSTKHLTSNAALPSLSLNTHHYFVVYAAVKDSVSQASNPVDVFIKPHKQLKIRPSQMFPTSYFREQELLRHSKKH